MRFPVQLAICAACAPLCLGQSITGSISGAIQDPGGLAVAAAPVKLTHLATGAQRETTTNLTGDFSFQSVVPGDYRLTISAPGFKTVERSGIRLSASDRLTLGGIALEVGAVAESVTVTGQGAVVQTASAERAGVITPAQIDGLSIRGRNVTSLLQLLPGVVDTGGAEGLSNDWRLNVQGNRNNTNSLNLDGAFLNATNMFNSVVTVSMDTVEEVKVLLTNYQAEYGRTSGANIQIVSKSGGKSFHGLASYFKRHEQFNANEFFRNQIGLPRPRYRYNTWTYQVGGPVTIPGKFNRNRDRLFFFWTQEFWPQSSGVLRRSTVPSALERAGDFSQSVDTNNRLIPVRDPQTNAPVPGNIMPAGRVDPSGAALLKLFPGVNFTDRAISGGQYNYTWTDETKTPVRTETAKVDLPLNSRNILAFNFTHSRFQWDGVNVPASANVGWPQLRQKVVNDGKVAIGRYQRIFSPTLINELSLSYSYRPWFSEQIPEEVKRNQRDTAGFRAGQFFPETNPFKMVPNATFAGVPGAATLGFEGRFPFDSVLTIFTVSNNLSKNFGAHTFKAGFYYDNTWHRNGNGQPFNGTFAFGRNVNNPLDTGYAYSNAALGVFDSYTEASLRPIGRYPIPSPEWFVQDNWKVTRRFTLDFGMRFIVISPEYTENFPAASFSPDAFDASKAPRLIEPFLDGSRRVGRHPVTGELYNAALVGAVAPGTGVAGNGMVSNKFDSNIPRTLVRNRGVQLGPRFGFAYDVFGNGSTALRGGFGMFYHRIPSGTTSNNVTVQPPLAERPIVYYGTLGTFLNAGRFVFPNSVTGLDLNLKNPTVMNYNLSVQRRIPGGVIADVGYVGSLGRALSWTRNINFIPFGANFDRRNFDPTTNRPYAAAFLRPYRGYEDINYWEPGGTSNYHSLQVTANRRFQNGLQFGAAWTWSKAMDYTDGDGQAVSAQVNPRVWNYGLAGFDRTHVVKVNFLYEVPKASVQSAIAKRVLHGWQISGIASFVSGAPTGVGFSTVAAIDITGTPTHGARVVVTGNPVLPKSERTFTRYFRTDVFRVPAVGSIGNAAKTQFRGPGRNNWDVSFFKDVPVRERMRFQFRAEMYNIFNHTQFTGVDAATRFDQQGNQVNARMGQLTSASDPRIVQLALRFYF